MPIVAFEGGDGSGKSTIIKSVAEWLTLTGRSANPVIARNPGATPLGRHLRRLVKDPAALQGTDQPIEIPPLVAQLLMLCDHAAFIESVWARQREDWLLMDRCNFISGLVYGQAERVDLGRLLGMYEITAQDAPLIDHLFVLRCSFETAQARRAERGAEKCRFEGRGEDFLQKIHETYEHLLEGELSGFLAADVVRCQDGKLSAEYVDADRGPGEVVSTITGRLKELFG